MNAPAKVAKAPDTLRIWNALSKTDPAHTKGFSRAGGFKGTAVKPMWVIKRLTELFGPCGEGWGIGEPRFETVHGSPGEILVYCTVQCWHGSPENTLYGVGGDRAAVMRKDGNPFFDDEAFKKAFTDAVNNAFKFIGVAADIHMGLFDDSKYVADVAKEFVANDRERQKVPGIAKIKERLNKLMREGDAATDLEAFNAMVTANKDDLQAIKDANHDYWAGDGEDSEGFKAWIKRRREELAGQSGSVERSLGFQMLASALEECATRGDLNDLLDQHGNVAEALDGEESRAWEALYNAREAAIMAIAHVDAG